MPHGKVRNCAYIRRAGIMRSNGQTEPLPSPPSLFSSGDDMTSTRRWITIAAAIVACAYPGVSARSQSRYSAASWTIAQQPTDIPFSGPIETIAVSPADSDRIIVASQTGGLFRSLDGGHTD